MLKFESLLRQQRLAKGLEQSDLAALIGVTRQSISNWETGKTIPNLAMINKLQNVLNCNFKEMIDTKNDSVEEPTYSYNRQTFEMFHNFICKETAFLELFNKIHDFNDIELTALSSAADIIIATRNKL